MNTEDVIQWLREQTPQAQGEVWLAGFKAGRDCGFQAGRDCGSQDGLIAARQQATESYDQGYEDGWKARDDSL